MLCATYFLCSSLCVGNRILNIIFFCQNPVLGLGLEVDFTFTPLHISPEPFAHLPSNLGTSPQQPKSTPTLLSNFWNEGIWVKS